MGVSATGTVGPKNWWHTSVRGLKPYIGIFQDLWGPRQEFLLPGHCLNRDACGHWLVGAGATYRTSSGSQCIQLWVSPSGFLFWQDYWQTVAGKAAAQLHISFRIYSMTESEELISRNSWTMSEWGWSWFAGHFRVHSWDRGLHLCSLMHRWAWLLLGLSLYCADPGTKANKAIDNYSEIWNYF